MGINVLIAMHLVASHWNAINVTTYICNNFDLKTYFTCRDEEDEKMGTSKEYACNIVCEDTHVYFEEYSNCDNQVTTLTFIDTDELYKMARETRIQKLRGMKSSSRR
jgi:hypothetical protein